MALKKPSDFFGENNKKSTNFIGEGVDSADKKSILKVTEEFNNFKDQIKSIKSVDDFVLTVESFRKDVEKIDTLSDAIDSLKEDIDLLVSKEDLDDAVSAQLLYVEKTIQDLKTNVKFLNTKTLVDIKENFKDLQESVGEFLKIDAPKYKKLVKESEIRVDKTLQGFKDYIENNFDEIERKIQSNFLNLSETLEGINQENLTEVYQKVSDTSKQVNDLLKKEFPKFNKFFAETELNVQQKIEDVDLKILDLEKLYEDRISSLKETVNNFINVEVAKYKKSIVETKLESDENVKDLERILNESIRNLSHNLSSLEENNNLAILEIKKDFLHYKDKLEQDNTLVIEEIKKNFLESKDKLDGISTNYENLYKDFKNREISENRKLESFSEEIDSLRSDIFAYKKKSIDESEKISTDLDEKIHKVSEDINNKILTLEENILSSEKNIREQDVNIERVKISLKNLSSKLREDLINETSEKIDKKISHLEEVLEKFNEKTVLSEGNSLLTDLPSTKTNDPLTPTDKNFVTFEDLANHYRTFINRVQIQMASIGGGGAGFIKDLDDVTFDQSTGTDQLLIYNGTKWVGIASTALGGGAGTVGSAGTWATSPAGIHTTKNVGIATTARADYVLYVEGDQYVDGNITIGGTITYEDVKNVDSLGIVTARTGIDVLAGGINAVGIVTATSFVGDGSGLTGVASTDYIITGTAATFNNQVFFNDNVLHTGIATFGSSNGIGTVTVGVGSTALYVDGDARIVGVLTVGRASITIDGENNTITSGIVTITNSTIQLGDNITISGGASGINSAPNVLYVAKDGNDSNNGTSIDNAFLTISAAAGVATTGTVIKVLAGNYLESNPIEVPAFVSIVGDDLKTVTVSPNVANDDIFHVRKGSYIANMTFTNHVFPAAAIGFPTTEVATNVGGGKWESPYIQNCTSNTTTGIGLRVDGAQAEGLKSIVCDSYTQYNQGGVGVAVTNQGFAQLVSIFTICCQEAISCHKGGQVDLTNSNSSFGTYGLVADGTSDTSFTGVVTSTASAAQDTITIDIGSETTRPYDGQVVYFDQLYQSVSTITVGSGGTGYTSTPTVTIDAPLGPNGETATAFATLDGDSVESITIISSGNQYTETPTITISAPQIGINTATATLQMAPIYYTINSSTPVVSGISTLTLDENLINTVGVGSTAYFAQVSRIVASSHTFEYVGSGNDITLATPKRGGVTIQENEVVTTNGGKVVYTSTDQSGNFRIGDQLQINQNTGTISGRAFTKSLFSEMTPFILALG